MQKSAYISYNHEDRTLTIKGEFGNHFKKEFSSLIKHFYKPIIVSNHCFIIAVSQVIETISFLKYILKKPKINKVNVNYVLKYLQDLETHTISLSKKHLIIGKPLTFKTLKRHIVKQKTSKKAIIRTKNISCSHDGHDLHVDTLVKTPDGWKHLEDMRIGDIVIGKTGLPITVTYAYPIEARQLYTIRFADGRSLLAGENHLWEVYLSLAGSIKQNLSVPVTLSTLEIKDFISIYKNKCYIDLIEPEKTTDKHLPIAPYMLGAMIAGGMLTNKYIWFNSVTYEYIETLQEYMLNGYGFYPHGDVGYELRPASEESLNYYLMFLDSLGLKGLKNKDKFIPKVYLDASADQRWDLLQGILDSGLIEKDRDSIIVLTPSENLANDIAYLMRSLGGIARVVFRDPSVQTSMFKVILWHSRAYKFFKVKHRINMFNFTEVYNKKLKLQITSISKSIIANSRCISVDSDDKLYVVENFIITKYSR